MAMIPVPAPFPIPVPNPLPEPPPTFSFSFSFMPILKISFNIFFTIVIFLLILGLLAEAIMLWVVIKPRYPFFKVQSVAVTRFNATADTGHLTALFDMNIYIQNPNPKLSITYESVEVVVWFDNHVVASTSLVRFRQGAGNGGYVQARFGVHRGVLSRGLLDQIVAQRANGSVQFGLILRGRVRFRRYGIVRTKVTSFNAQCFPLQIVFPTGENNTNIGWLMAPVDCYIP